jgi:hypothetical protein
VYLCSGDEDLSTYGGQKASVYRYNHSQEYVDLVISIMNAYLGGDYSSVPNGVATTTVLTPSYDDAVFTSGTTGRTKTSARDADAKTRDGGGRTGGTADGGSGGTSGGGTGDETPGVPSGGDDPTGGTPLDVVEDTVKDVTDTVKDTTEDVTDTVEDTTEDVTDGVDEATGGTLTKAEATAQCVASGVSALDTAALEACVAELLN